MLKGKKALWAIAAILVVGVASFVIYQKYMEELSTIRVQEHIEKVCKLDEITRVEYQTSDQIVLEKQNGVWMNANLGKLKYDQVKMQEWISILQNAETKEIVKHVQDKSAYGIGEQSPTITLYNAKGETQILQIGDIIDAEDSLYVQSDHENVLYVLSYEKEKELLTRPNDFVDCSSVLEKSEIQSIRIDNHQTKEVKLTKEADTWRLRDYYKVPGYMNDKTVKEIIEPIEGLTLERYVGTYEDLSDYGLSEPHLTLNINEIEKIAFGSHSGDEIYVSINDGKDVYTVDKKLYAALSGFKPFDYMDKQVVHLTSDQIQGVTLENPQGTYTLDFSMTPEEEQTTTTEADEAVTSKNETMMNHSVKDDEKASDVTEQNIMADGQPFVARLNEVPLTAEEAKEWLDKIEASVSIESPLQNPNIEQKQERKAEAVMVYVLNDGSKMQIEFIPYDINYYILRYNGVIEFAVNKEKVTKLFNELTHFTKQS